MTDSDPQADSSEDDAKRRRDLDKTRLIDLYVLSPEKAGQADRPEDIEAQIEDTDQRDQTTARPDDPTDFGRERIIDLYTLSEKDAPQALTPESIEHQVADDPDDPRTAEMELGPDLYTAPTDQSARSPDEVLVDPESDMADAAAAAERTLRTGELQKHLAQDDAEAEDDGHVTFDLSDALASTGESERTTALDPAALTEDEGPDEAPAQIPAPSAGGSGLETILVDDDGPQAGELAAPTTVQADPPPRKTTRTRKKAGDKKTKAPKKAAKKKSKKTTTAGKKKAKKKTKKKSSKKKAAKKKTKGKKTAKKKSKKSKAGKKKAKKKSAKKKTTRKKKPSR